MINAVIFDMDGLLIDSEPFWREADIEVFESVGIKLTHEMCMQTMGLACIETVKLWYGKQPWQGKSIEQVRDEIEQHLVDKVRSKGKAMPGTNYIIDFFNQKQIPLALASSSAMHIIEAVIEKLQIKSHFKIIHSAEFEKAGKPSPDVFISTAKMLNIEPKNCLVFEDSVNGVKAGIAAGMKVVAVPEPHMQADKRYNIAHLVIGSLNDFQQKHWEALQQ